MLNIGHSITSFPAVFHAVEQGEKGVPPAAEQGGHNLLVPSGPLGAQGGKGADLAHFFNADGLGAVVNSSRGIIAAYKQEQYSKFGEKNFADASRAAVGDMIADIDGALRAVK